MPIYVAYNYDNYPINIVVSKSEELAKAYWHGKGILPNRSREITLEDLKNHPTGVLPIMSTDEKTGYDLSNRRKEATYILVTKD